MINKDIAKHLRVQLVPRMLWGNNIRTKLHTKDWKIISDYVRNYYNNICQICGDKGKMHCHEVYSYDVNLSTNTGVQTLEKFQCLCPTCHSTIHIGEASSRLSRLELLTLERRVCKLMNITEGHYKQHVRAAYDTHNLYNEYIYNWKQDFKGLI